MGDDAATPPKRGRGRPATGAKPGWVRQAESVKRKQDYASTMAIFLLVIATSDDDEDSTSMGLRRMMRSNQDLETALRASLVDTDWARRHLDKVFPPVTEKEKAA